MDGFWLINTRGQFLEVNEAYCRMSGYSKKEILEMNVSDFDINENELKIGEHLVRIPDNGDQHFISVHKCKNGSLINVEVALHYLPYDTGEVIVFIKDITKHKVAEAVLHAKTKRLEMALRASNAALWDWDVSTGKIEWSLEMFGLLGRDPLKESPSFETWRKAVHSEDIEMAEHRIESALRLHERLDSYYRVITPDGSVKWIYALGEGVYNEQGEPIQMLGLCIDVTDRKSARDSLLERERYFTDIFENASVGVAYASLTGEIIAINRTLEEIIEIHNDEIVGENILDLAKRILTPDDFNMVVPILNSLLKNKKEEPFEVDYKGKILELSVTGSGESNRLTAVIRDITSHRNIETDLNKKVKELEYLNNLMLNREVKMIGLKNEINLLLKELGRNEKYLIYDIGGSES
jgi:PAS domain S-box-containing protein